MCVTILFCSSVFLFYLGSSKRPASSPYGADTYASLAVALADKQRVSEAFCMILLKMCLHYLSPTPSSSTLTSDEEWNKERFSPDYIFNATSTATTTSNTIIGTVSDTGTDTDIKDGEDNDKDKECCRILTILLIHKQSLFESLLSTTDTTIQNQNQNQSQNLNIVGQGQNQNQNPRQNAQSLPQDISQGQGQGQSQGLGLGQGQVRVRDIDRDQYSGEDSTIPPVPENFLLHGLLQLLPRDGEYVKYEQYLEYDGEVQGLGQGQGQSQSQGQSQGQGNEVGVTDGWEAEGYEGVVEDMASYESKRGGGGGGGGSDFAVLQSEEDERTERFCSWFHSNRTQVNLNYFSCFYYRLQGLFFCDVVQCRDDCPR